MYAFAAYDIVKARQAEAARRATRLAQHAEGARARRRARTLRMRVALAVAPAPAAAPACCAA